MNGNTQSAIILMADDDADDRLLAQDALKECQWDHELHFVEDGRELLDYLRRRGKYSTGAACPRPGLILLDLNMPRKGGQEALQEMKNDPQLCRIPVVVLTTSTAERDIECIYELGANSFITKPVHFDSLVHVMNTIGQYWFGIVKLPAQR